jgi:hypothetical protein
MRNEDCACNALGPKAMARASETRAMRNGFMVLSEA